MSIEQIRKKQLAIRAAQEEKARQREVAENEKAAAFQQTGIPEMWEKLKNIEVQHWRENLSRNTDSGGLVPLAEHLYRITATGLILKHKSGGFGNGWYVHKTDKGAIRYVAQAGDGSVVEFHEPDKLREAFVNFMADFLPLLPEELLSEQSCHQ